MVTGAFFPDKLEYTAVPKLFLSDLLPRIDSLAELKVSLYLFRALSEKRGYPRFVTYTELAGNQALIRGLAEVAASCGGSPTDVLRDGLGKAVARGGFLRLKMNRGADEEEIFLLNTAKNQQALDQIRSGKLAIRVDSSRREWQPVGGPAQDENIFTLYENEIGLLTPSIAEQLKDAEAHFPLDWIKEAIAEAAAQNARSWRYIEAILRRWEKEGKTIGKPGRDPEAPPGASKYYEGYWGELLKQRERDR